MNEMVCIQIYIYIYIYKNQFFIILDDCNNQTIRLVGGATSWEGRVEVCADGRWGTVCDEGWTNQSADLMCTHFGYPGEGNMYIYSTSNAKIYQVSS